MGGGEKEVIKELYRIGKDGKVEMEEKKWEEGMEGKYRYLENRYTTHPKPLSVTQSQTRVAPVALAVLIIEASQADNYGLSETRETRSTIKFIIGPNRYLDVTSLRSILGFTKLTITKALVVMLGLGTDCRIIMCNYLSDVVWALISKDNA
ncbi:hypothetical protein Tco_1099279 [Tanacetum coccineum]